MWSKNNFIVRVSDHRWAFVVPPSSIFPYSHSASKQICTACTSIIAGFLWSIFAVKGHHRSHAETSEKTPTLLLSQTQTAAQEKKNKTLTQDSTLRMVCGCLANAMGSTVDPVRPAPNDPTPSIFFSVCAPRSRLRGCMDALLFFAVGTGPCAHPQPRGHSARKGACTDSHDRAAASEKLLFLRQHRSIRVCVPVINH